MDMIKEKIRVMAQKLSGLCTLSSTPVKMEYVWCEEYKKNNTPPAADAGWMPMDDYTVFEGEDQHYWLHTKIKTISKKRHFASHTTQFGS